MKHTVLVLLAAAIAAPCLADTTWVTVGSPEVANSYPFAGAGTDAFRFQLLYLQSEIDQPGEIVAFGLMTSYAGPSDFYNVRVNLCHTGITALGDTFAKNYGGNQPVEVLNEDTLAVGRASDWYYFPCSFVYNNTDNLLFEVMWRGDAGQTIRFMRNVNSGAYRRAWSYGSDSAKTGQLDAVQGYYARLGFLPTGVEETGHAVPRAALRVEPTLGRGRFAVRLNVPALGVKVTDVAGRAVADLDPVGTGTGSTAEWDAQDIPAGVYVIQARTRHEQLRQQVIVSD